MAQKAKRAARARRRTPARVAAEQVVLASKRASKRYLWTLRQLRAHLRLARARFHLAWRSSGDVWYAAIRTVYGVPVRKIMDPRQLDLDWRTR